MSTGTIKSYDKKTGDGMIAPTDPAARDVYFNKPNVEGGDSWVCVGVKIQYELYPQQPGSTQEAKVVRRDQPSLDRFSA